MDSDRTVVTFVTGHMKWGLSWSLKEKEGERMIRQQKVKDAHTESREQATWTRPVVQHTRAEGSRRQ